MAWTNKHRGSRFDESLREQGLFDEVQAAATKRAIGVAVGEAGAFANGPVPMPQPGRADPQ